MMVNPAAELATWLISAANSDCLKVPPARPYGVWRFLAKVLSS